MCAAVANAHMEVAPGRMGALCAHASGGRYCAGAGAGSVGGGAETGAGAGADARAAAPATGCCAE